MTSGGLLISASFWLALAAWCVLDRASVGLLPLRLRYAATVAVSLGFLVVFAGVSLLHLGVLGVLLCVLYGAARAWVAAPASGRAGPGFVIVLAAAAGIWSLGKIGASLDLGRLSWLFILGGSFLFVKVWTFLKDLHDGRVPDAELLPFLAYCFFFPCFVSGPMHYYGEFRKSFEERTPLDLRAFIEHGFRALHGLVKVLVVAVALRPFSLEPLRDAGVSEVDPAALALRSVVYSLVLYLDFSGYTDIVIGAGGMLGIRVPENFRQPYLAPNLRDFWQRWHMTFTRVLTQYLFVPFTRLAQTRFAGASARATATTAYLATFLFCGFWHGSTLNFLAWGVFHGLGLSVYDVYRTARMRRARERRQPLRSPTPPVRAAVTLVTFLFVSAGWLLFVLPLQFWTR